MNNIKECKEHIVAFIDLMGFKDAINHNQENEILNLLQRFSDETKNFFTENKEEIQGERQITIDPAISIFSDSIIISMPINESIPEVIMMPSFNKWIALFAALALKKGFLIRGGITKGNLYHNEDEHIVFGKAYLEANKLESGLANYPRIIVSPTLYDFFSSNDMFMEDFDGMRILNYINGPFGLIHSSTQEDRAIFDKKISANIENLTSEIKTDVDKMKDLSRWVWFNKHYQNIKNREEDLLTCVTRMTVTFRMSS